MQGYFDLKALDTGDMPESEVLAAKEGGRLQELLSSLPVLHRARGNNLIVDQMAGYILDAVFAGPTVAPFNYSTGEGMCAFAQVALTSADSEPTYQDLSYGDWYFQEGTSIIAFDCAKRIITDDYLDRFEIDKVGGDGRHTLWFRNEFLWLPSQCNSNIIRSLIVRSSEECDFTASGGYLQERWRSMIARIRLKDDRGRKIEFRKTDRMILWLSWTFYLTSF